MSHNRSEFPSSSFLFNVFLVGCSDIQNKSQATVAVAMRIPHKRESVSQHTQERQKVRQKQYIKTRGEERERGRN